MTDAWSPDRYECFQDEREAPFHDVHAGLERDDPVETVVDLGCGTGRLTELLHRTLGARSTIGVDSSPAMLERASGHRVDGLELVLGSIESFEPEAPVDLVFSNAALHWVADHHALLERLASWLAPGGQLAFQVPTSFDHPAHRVVASIAREQPFGDVLDGWRPGRHVLAPEDYATILYRLGFPEPRVQLCVYPHVLEGPEALCNWLAGTSLTPYRERLGEGLYPLFVDAIREALVEQAGDERPLFFPFKRILAWARRARP